ncbi:VOC family protein [Tsuneonella sp. SYSU-LHT278]|uniref:VOC family protein n=1 Tax=Tsuneonella sediminis TaxID=3416089 RepID=UPI003F796A3F
MTKSIFINLPVADLSAAERFYEAAGFEKNSDFSDETACCMVWSGSISVMLLTHQKWAAHTDRPLCPPNQCEVMLALSVEDKEAVDAMVDAAGSHGGRADVNPRQDHGFMYGRSFADPDGHIWEVIWMDAAAMTQAN